VQVRKHLGPFENVMKRQQELLERDVR
jgi:hypothetical protein